MRIVYYRHTYSGGGEHEVNLKDLERVITEDHIHVFSVIGTDEDFETVKNELTKIPLISIGKIHKEDGSIHPIYQRTLEKLSKQSGYPELKAEYSATQFNKGWSEIEYTS